MLFVVCCVELLAWRAAAARKGPAHPGAPARAAPRLPLPVSPQGGDAPEAAADVVVVGGGLAGLTAALALLDRGARVALVEKEGAVGGNSARASSGVNAVAEGDSPADFAADCRRSAGAGEGGGTAPNFDPGLAGALTQRSGAALQWLQQRVGVRLAARPVQLGGHSRPRTFRPSAGLAGTELVTALRRRLNPLAPRNRGRLTVLLRARATGLMLDRGRVTGVRWRDDGDEYHTAGGRHGVVLATGGFAFGGNESLLRDVRPDLAAFPTTNGPWATGDGVHMAREAGAALVGMDSVQVHPTGFLDDAAPQLRTKTLCAELLRGVGGLLLLPNATRFADELGTRRYLAGRLMSSGAQATGVVLLLHDAAAQQAERHVSLYSRKGLLRRFDSPAAVAGWMARRWGGAAEERERRLRTTLAEYNAAAAAGGDEHGKRAFHATPIDVAGGFHAGVVVPVVHYTMGGVRIDAEAKVLGASGVPVPGLWAAGELTGGLHGANRLGGNGLTECVVFGRAAAASVPVADRPLDPEVLTPSPPLTDLPLISAGELRAHGSARSCWVALHGRVYDLTAFAETHPGGARSVTFMAGQDGTAHFEAAHSEELLSDFTPIGRYGEGAT
eukprot:TRINITY_DN50439_c0_g1_i1.p2 TRINITY_DN50439_c0_g1~~TRINITY_DN50439_c0_g1_i1.p2  ORF type:complete len:663 (+),score=184.20 TRINITY_DN50439_c0_g1_i1:146-1990(+)